jgi:hypothetical protein
VRLKPTETLWRTISSHWMNGRSADRVGDSSLSFCLSSQVNIDLSPTTAMVMVVLMRRDMVRASTAMVITFSTTVHTRAIRVLCAGKKVILRNIARMQSDSQARRNYLIRHYLTVQLVLQQKAEYLVHHLLTVRLAQELMTARRGIALNALELQPRRNILSTRAARERT